jgi:predicted protein tyrosine phosphatase
MVLFSPKQARQIVEFVASHQGGIGAVVVHCHQGMSRSPAVAAALCKAMGGDEGQFWQGYCPNAYVYELVCQAADGKFK